jgi:hypothetical protein
MPVRFSCPQCHSKLSAPDKALGRKSTCPKCRTPVVVATAPPTEGWVTAIRPAEDPRLTAFAVSLWSEPEEAPA